MTVLVDAHVHFHACFDRETFLEGAASNFTRAAGSLGLPGRPSGVLMLTEISGQDYFRRWLATARNAGDGHWTVEGAGDDLSLRASKDDGRSFLIVAGRQIRTSVGVEVLALGCDRDLGDGGGLEETLEEVRRVGATPVLPWGFGKWWFKRGRVVETVIRRERPGNLFLGDIAGRPAHGPRPWLFGLAEGRGIRLLPGSDPLPFQRQVARPGSFGLALEGELDEDEPTESLMDLLRDRRLELVRYGSGARLPTFVRDQVSMQLRKRFRRTAS